MLSNAILYMLGKSIVEGQATDPQPEPGQADVPFDIVLGWTAGESAQTHDVYVGLSSADVTNASRTAPLGVLAGKDQSAGSFAPTNLQFGQTYYWRVDEVDASSAIAKGETWSFTVEPLSYPIANVTATASSAQATMGPENTVNGSGLSASDQHSTEPSQMWMSKGEQPNWIQYQFDKVYKLTEMWVWNSNQMIESFVGFGAKTVTIEYSVDGVTWTALAGVPEFAQAPGRRPTLTTRPSISAALAQVRQADHQQPVGAGAAGRVWPRSGSSICPCRPGSRSRLRRHAGWTATVTLGGGRAAQRRRTRCTSAPIRTAWLMARAAAVTVTDHSYSPRLPSSSGPPLLEGR